MYLVREGIDPKTPASVRWSARLKSVDKPPATEQERLLPLKNHSISLKDLMMLKPDALIYSTTDTEKAEKVMEKLGIDLKGMPCHEFYEKWVIRPNFDFLLTERDRMDFGM